MEHLLSTAFASGKPVTFQYTVRHAIARGAGKHVWVCLKANHEEAEEGVRLEFVERHGFEPEEIEAWPVLDSMIS
jgi:hypothetical protein